MNVRFSLRVEKDAVIYPRSRGDERITLDGSVIEEENNNGSIEPGDPVFEKLLVWNDWNGDGISQKHELRTLFQVGILSLRTSANIVNDRLENSASRVRLLSTFESVAGPGKLVDVFFYLDSATQGVARLSH